MSSNVVVCQVDPELQSQLTRFRSRKEKVASALVMKVDKETQTVVLDELLEDLESLEELRDSLPDHQPRFIVYTCCLSHSDGRSSFPMCFIFFSPRDCKPEMQMMYAGSKLELVNKVILSPRDKLIWQKLEFIYCHKNLGLNDQDRKIYGIIFICCHIGNYPP